MKTFKLTKNELKASMILVVSCLEGMGGKRPSDLEDDEYTWIKPEDLIEKGYTKHEASGTWGSLIEKGIIEPYDDGMDVLSTEAWKYLDTIWDEQRRRKF